MVMSVNQLGTVNAAVIRPIVNRLAHTSLILIMVIEPDNMLMGEDFDFAEAAVDRYFLRSLRDHLDSLVGATSIVMVAMYYYTIDDEWVVGLALNVDYCNSDYYSYFLVILVVKRWQIQCYVVLQQVDIMNGLLGHNDRDLHKFCSAEYFFGADIGKLALVSIHVVIVGQAIEIYDNT